MIEPTWGKKNLIEPKGRKSWLSLGEEKIDCTLGKKKLIEPKGRKSWLNLSEEKVDWI